MTRTERAALLDVNVLLALAWPNHVHHARARDWLAGQRRHGWATCPLTESGFVRISSHPRVGPEPRSIPEALAWLEAARSQPGHFFLTDDVSLVTSPHVLRDRLVGHRQVTDAHLLALALRHDLRLATFDRGVGSLLPDAEAVARGLCLLA